LRIELRLPNYLFAAKGSISGEVQFHSTATTAAHFPVQNPTMYCQQDPDVLMPCFVAGNPEGGGTGGSLDALVRFPYTSSGSTPSPTQIAVASQVGTVWGATYQRETKTLVLSEFLKRHCGLETMGLGGLYLTDLTTAPGSVSSYIDIENYGIDLGTSTLAGRTLPASATTISADPLAFGKVGKVGIGSIDLNDAGDVLWMVDMYNRSLIRFNIGNPVKPAASVSNADFSTFAIPNPGCTGGTYRPWALEFYEGKVYLGMVCSAESGGAQTDLTAYVYRFDPATSTWDSSPLVSFSLNYPKGDVHSSFPAFDKWEQWTDVFADIHDAGSAGSPAATRKIRPQPILTDIQFDKRGNMILGFCDRTGHQTGRVQVNTSGTGLFNGYVGGDILYLTANGAGGFTLENNGAFTGGPTGSGAGNGEGPGGGEFFANDNYITTHLETMQGGMIYHPSRDEIISNQMDPLTIWSGGVVRHDVSDGSSTAAMRYQIYNTGTANGTFGKANGLGMVELACDALIVELGLRVWEDTDADGIQDANDAGLAGVAIELFADFDGDGVPDGPALGTATSNAAGNVVFDGSNVADGDPTKSGAQAGPAFGKRYIMLPAGSVWSAGTGAGVLNGYTPTTTNADPSGTGDLRDNDASGASYGVPATVGASGQNNFTFSMGFRAPPVCSLTITSAVPTACIQPANTYDLVVIVTYSTQPTGDITINGQTFSPNGSGIDTFTVTGITANGATGVAVNAAFVNDTNCSATSTYDAPVSCACPSGAANTLCPGESYTLMAQAGHTNIQWQSGPSITGPWTNIAGATNSTYIVTTPGFYRYTSTDTSGCASNLCCPVEIVPGTNCCPTPNCGTATIIKL
jgi:SdrD B-like domain